MNDTLKRLREVRDRIEELERLQALHQQQILEHSIQALAPVLKAWQDMKDVQVRPNPQIFCDANATVGELFQERYQTRLVSSYSDLFFVGQSDGSVRVTRNREDPDEVMSPNQAVEYLIAWVAERMVEPA